MRSGKKPENKDKVGHSDETPAKSGQMQHSTSTNRKVKKEAVGLVHGENYKIKEENLKTPTVDRAHRPKTARKVEERQLREVSLPEYVGNLLVFPRGGLKYSGRAELGNETKHKKDLDKFYKGGVNVGSYAASLNFELSGLEHIVENRNCVLNNPFPKQKFEDRRRTLVRKQSTTNIVDISDVGQNGWDFLRRICNYYDGKDNKDGKEKISRSLFKLAKSLESSKDEDLTGIIENAAPKEVIPFLLQNFYEKNKKLVDVSASHNDQTASIFYKQALQAELFLLAWQMTVLELENKKLEKVGGKFRKNVNLLGMQGDGEVDMLYSLKDKSFAVKKVYNDNLAFPKSVAINQYNALFKRNDLNIAERDPATRPSTLRYGCEESPLSEAQSMYWQSIEKRLRENGGLVELVAKHGSGKSEFVSRIEGELDYKDPVGLNLDELLRLNESKFSDVAELKGEAKLLVASPYSPAVNTNIPNPISPTAEKRRVSGVGIDKIKSNIRPFKINLHSSPQEIGKINSFIRLQDSILKKGAKAVLQDLKDKGTEGNLGRDDAEMLKNLKFISKIKPIIFADEFYYFDEKQLGDIENKTAEKIEEVKYSLIDKWAKFGSTVVALGASASLGKIEYECEEISEKIKQEQNILNKEGNKKYIDKARSFLYSFNGKNLKEKPVFFKVIDERKSVVLEEEKELSKARKKKSNIEWKNFAQVEVSGSKAPALIKVNKKGISNREYLIRTAWHIKELGKFAPDNIQNCKEYANVIKALTPMCFEARNHAGDAKYLWEELDNLDEILSLNKRGKRGRFSLGEEELYRAVKTFICNDLCDSFPSGKNQNESQSGSTRTRISELKEELESKQYQYDELDNRINDAIKRFKKFSFDLEEPKDKSAGLYNVVQGQLQLLGASEKMQYILPHFKIDEESCTDKDIINILKGSAANVVILPHKEELKCKIAYIKDDELNVKAYDVSTIDTELEEIQKNKEKSCTDHDIINILKGSTANVVILPHKEEGSEELKCKIAYINGDSELSVKVYDISAIDTELEKIQKNKEKGSKELKCKIAYIKGDGELSAEAYNISAIDVQLEEIQKSFEKDISILSFYDVDDAIGGDRKKAAVLVNYQTIHATDKSFLVKDDSIIRATFQEFEQNERRNRTDLDNIKEGSVISKFVMPSDTEGVDINKCVPGSEIPQEIMEAIARNTTIDNEIRRNGFVRYCGKDMINHDELLGKVTEVVLDEVMEDVLGKIEKELKEASELEASAKFRLDERDEFVPIKLNMDMEATSASVMVDNSIKSNLEEEQKKLEEEGEEEEEQKKLEEEEELRVDIYRDIEVNDDDLYHDTSLILNEDETSNEGYFEEPGIEVDIIDISEDEELRIPRTGVRSHSMLSLSRVVSGNIFELVKFILMEENCLYSQREETGSDKLVYCSNVYSNWKDVVETIKKIIVESALSAELDGDQMYEALITAQLQGGFGNVALEHDREDELDEEVREKYINFSARFQKLCKSCGIFSTEFSEGSRELVGFSLGFVPESIVLNIVEDLSSGYSPEELRKQYNCDLDNKSKMVEKEIYKEEKVRSQSLG